MRQTREAGVTVIVCCFNSSMRIAETLGHLAAQRLPAEINMEVLIVDNASEDNLESVVKDAWKPSRMDYTLRIVTQPICGLANARMKGVLEAAFDYAVFCDDDNWLSPRYVSTVHSLLTTNANIGVVGGVSTPMSEGELPDWFFPNAYAYAVGEQSEKSGDITERHYLWGAGMGFYLPFLRKAFEVGLRPILADRTGNELLSGNDTELCFWYIMGGYRLWYDDKLEFQHYIPAFRMQREYLQKVKDGFRQVDPILRSYKSFLVLRGKMDYWTFRAWTQSHLKAIVAWSLTNRSIRTKIRDMNKAIKSFGRAAE